VMAGETLGLVGESGCGKTTVGRAVLRLDEPTAGTIRFGGVDITHASHADMRGVRRKIQVIFQDPYSSLNPRMTVGQIIGEPMRVYRLVENRKAERARVEELLAQVGLFSYMAERYPHELSGGQRQRVVIAGALALDPKVLIADEPVASLDASVRGEILALLLRLRDDLGLSALVVTHDLGLAWNIADRVAVMYLGRIVESGPTEDVLTNPQHPYTQALLSVLPESPNRIVLTGEPPDPTRVPAGCRFHPRCQLVAQGNGTAACGTQPLPILPAGTAVQVACHVAAP